MRRERSPSLGSPASFRIGPASGWTCPSRQLVRISLLVALVAPDARSRLGPAVASHAGSALVHGRVTDGKCRRYPKGVLTRRDRSQDQDSLWGPGAPSSRRRSPQRHPTTPRVVALGRDRFEHPRFIAARSHYGYDSFYCVPGKDGAQEKGGVEGEIGRFR